MTIPNWTRGRGGDANAEKDERREREKCLPSLEEQRQKCLIAAAAFRILILNSSSAPFIFASFIVVFAVWIVDRVTHCHHSRRKVAACHRSRAAQPEKNSTTGKKSLCSSIVNIPPPPTPPQNQGAIVEAKRAFAVAFDAAVRMKRKIMKLRGGTSWIRDLFIAPMVCVLCF